MISSEDSIGGHSAALSSASLPGVLESDYPAGEEVHQELESSQGDGVSLAGSVASMGSTGSDGALAEGTTAIPQSAGSGATEQPAEQGLVSGSGTFLFLYCVPIMFSYRL